MQKRYTHFSVTFDTPCICDFKAVNDELISIPWNDVLSLCMDLDCRIDKFHEVLNSIIDSHVPVQRTAVHNFPSWYTAELIALIINEKRSLHQIWKTSKQSVD